DVGIKIGLGETAAGYRVDEPIDAVRILAHLLETRRNWLYGERAVPIERHSMLANGRTVALVAPDSTVSWLCHPDPDSSAIFAELLGGTSAGHFRVRPAARNGIPLGQRYRPGTMSVETRWSGLTVTDWLDRGLPPGEPEESPECTSLVRVLSGAARAVVEFWPCPAYGHVRVSL